MAETLEDVYDQFDPMARYNAMCWVGGYITASNGVFDMQKFMQDAAGVMPPQIIDEAIEKWRLRMEWPDGSRPFFRVATPDEDVVRS